MVSCVSQASVSSSEDSDTVEAAPLGHMNFESPHSNPIAHLASQNLVYVVNTPADTVDVIDTESNEMISRINVGIDPVGIAIRPDGKEVWVTNHVSDSISVIDSDPESATYHHVLHTIQALHSSRKYPMLDEPVGVVDCEDIRRNTRHQAILADYRTGPESYRGSRRPSLCHTFRVQQPDADIRLPSGESWYRPALYI